MLRLQLGDQQFYCLLRCDLYERFEGIMVAQHGTKAYVGRRLYKYKTLHEIYIEVRCVAFLLWRLNIS